MKKRLLYLAIIIFLLSALALDLGHIKSRVLAVTSGWAISGDNVYFNDGNVGIGTSSPQTPLHIQTQFDHSSSPVNLSEVYDGDGEFNLLNGAYTVTVSGNYAYVGSYADDSFTIMDISDPTNPVIKSEVYDGDGEFNKLNNIDKIRIYGNYAYVVTASSEDALTIIDISDPTDPDLQSEVYDGDGEFNKLDGIHDVAVSGDYAYVVSANEDSLTIMDISDPTDPDLVVEKSHGQDLFDKFQSPRSIVISGNYAYIASINSNSITVVNISNPNYPSADLEIYDGDGEFSQLGGVRNLELNGSNLIATSSNDDSITIIDISSPTNPDLVSEVYNGDGEFSSIRDILSTGVIGNYLVAPSIATSGDNKINIIDISDPSDPSPVTTIQDGTGGFNRLDNVFTVDVDSNYIYATSYNDDALTIIGLIEDYDTLTATTEGKVGIGTSDPKTSLDINGAMKLKNNSSAPFTCDSDTDSSIAVTSGYRTCICKSGTGWVYTSDGSTSCSW